MPPSFATLLTLGFIFLLFVHDARQQTNTKTALWLPVCWMSITGTRFVSEWLSLGSTGSSVDLHEGSPIDALYFLTLILLGIIVLSRRHIVFREVVSNNWWLAAFFIYGLISIAWSEFPFIAFKRWIKAIGHPIMALIILSDPNPQDALRSVMKRCAYLMMPLSVLFVKYYPDIGRGFDPWTGEAFNNGAMHNKNELGYGCMLFGLFFFWNLLLIRTMEHHTRRQVELIITAVFLCIIGWLLHIADSATSLSTLVIGMATITFVGFRIVNKRYIGTYVIVFFLVAVAAQVSFDIYAQILELLGRNPTLTDRTALWADSSALVENPIIGAGFESFWLGPRLDQLWAKWWWQPNQAHSGYIETYLNLGAIGVVLLLGLVVATFRKICEKLLTDFQFARLRLGFLFAILFYNYTEAAFKAVHLVWTVFHIIAIDYPNATSDRSRHHRLPRSKLS